MTIDSASAVGVRRLRLLRRNVDMRQVLMYELEHIEMIVLEQADRADRQKRMGRMGRMFIIINVRGAPRGTEPRVAPQ